MKNNIKERVVEELTRELLKTNGDYLPESEQYHLNNGKIPEFTIFKGNYALVIECKTFKSKINNAVVEVKDYALELVKEYNVIAVAIAGSKNTEFKSFYLKKEDSEFKPLKSSTLLSMDDYTTQIEILEKADELNEKTLKSKADELNNLIRTHADVGIQNRATLIAALLIAIENKAFRESYKNEADVDLPVEVYTTIEKVLNAEINFPVNKKNAILAEFAFIQTTAALAQKKNIEGKVVTPLLFFIDYLVNKVYLKLKENSKMDLLAEFYTEFFKRTSLSGKELGIVLTPEHVKQFMARLININKTDIVLDTCTGTGGFLITAMNIMLEEAETKEERNNIKANQLIGVEKEASMFLMAYASMKFHGDGKSNLYLGNSLDPMVIKSYEDRANKCLINPPYSLGKKDKDMDEWNFVLTSLNALRQSGKLAVIIPISKFIGKASEDWKKKILKSHTLEAVISMPQEIFEVGTITAIGVFTAHVPHTNNDTMLYDLRDDGFVIDRKEGRKDAGNWDALETSICKTLANKKEIKGTSISKSLAYKDEWLYVSHAEVDWDNLTEDQFLVSNTEYSIYDEGITEETLKLLLTNALKESKDEDM